MLGEDFRRKRSCNCAINLPSLDTTEKELLYPDEDSGDDLLKVPIVWRAVERRVYKHAALMLAVVNRTPDDLGEEDTDRLARRQRLAAAHTIYDASFDVMIQRPLIKGPFIPERVVKTGPRDPRFLDEIPNGSCFVATPKTPPLAKPGEVRPLSGGGGPRLRDDRC